MSGILFLAHRLPFPPDRGDKIRSHHILKALAELAPVHVGCFAETPVDRANEGELAAIAKSHFMPTRSKPLAVAAIESLVRGKPVSLTAFEDPRLAKWVDRVIVEHDIDTIYVFSGQMGQYVPGNWRGRLIVDLVDVDSAKFEAYASEKLALRSWINGREASRLRREEAGLAARADHTLLVSEAEAALLAARLGPATQANISVLHNGIDTEVFNPGRTVPHRALTRPGPHFVFTGQMDYAPNAAAALRAIDRLMPLIRAHHPKATFHVVGRAPGSQLLAREGVNGARVWGEVPDVRPFLAAADLVLVPLTLARGVQNKVLEAMAMARPVLMTSEAATGLPGTEGVHFATAETDAELAERALALITAPTKTAEMGKAARRLVMEQRSWPAMLAGLPALLANPVGSRSDKYAA